MYLLSGLYLVTMETFVVQRGRSTPPSMVYTTLDNTLDKRNGSQLKAMCTDSDERSDLTTCQLRSIEKFKMNGWKSVGSMEHSFV